MIEKPYRIIRKYYNAEVVKTYTNDYATLDKAYKAIIRMIDEADPTHSTSIK